MSDNGLMTIGEVAGRTGLRASALRYYESVGLARPSERRNGRRLYDESIFQVLALIRLAQAAGFSIAEVKELLHGFGEAAPASARWQALARRKLIEVVRKIERAQRTRLLLEQLTQCRCETLAQCVRPRLYRLDPGARRAS